MSFESTTLRAKTAIMCSKLLLLLSIVFVVTLVGDASGTIVPGSSITAEAASQFDTDTGPEKSVDGSGMLTGDYRGTHNKTRSDMWLSAARGGGSSQNHPFGLDCSTWIKYEFDQPYCLGKMRVYNYNEAGSTAAGLWNVYVHYSQTGGNDPAEWMTLGGVGKTYLFTQATGRYGERGKDEADFDGDFAKDVVITAAVDNGNFGHSHYGLAEVRFNIVPEPGAVLLLTFGGLAVLRKRRR